MDLRSIYLFENLKEEDLKYLESIAFTKRFGADEMLFYEGDASTYLHILTKGTLKIFKTNKKGDEIVLHHFYATSLVAEMPNIEGIPFPASAKFKSEGEVIKIDFEKFKDKLLSKPEVSLQIIKSLSSKIRNLDNFIIQEKMLDATAKTAQFIYNHEELFTTLKQKEVASILNLKPESLSRILKKLKEQAIIVNEHNTFKVLDKEALTSFFEL